MASSILASAMAFIDGTALNVILPALQKDLQATGSGLFWILNSYLLTLAALILIGGTLGDNLGTAAAMGSVSEHFSGTASGVNNAMTRVANVFANAIFGALSVLFFTGELTRQTTHLQVNPATKNIMQQEAKNLGNAKVPPKIPNNQKPQIQKAYHQSFIHAYAIIMRISAALAFLGALTTVGFIGNLKQDHFSDIR